MSWNLLNFHLNPMYTSVMEFVKHPTNPKSTNVMEFWNLTLCPRYMNIMDTRQNALNPVYTNTCIFKKLQIWRPWKHCMKLKGFDMAPELGLMESWWLSVCLSVREQARAETTDPIHMKFLVYANWTKLETSSQMGKLVKWLTGGGRLSGWGTIH